MNLTRPESSVPMRLFQACEAVAGAYCSVFKEAILEMTGQKNPVLPILDRLSLRIENGLDTLDDLFPMRQKKSQQLDVCRKRATR